MSAIVAIVGRPNVGKSTLFNRLTRSRLALVDDLPGVTRDRLYGQVRTDQGPFTLVDTGGFNPPADQDFAPQVHAQIELALAEADLILFLLDAKAGLNPLDYEVAQRLRSTQKPVLYLVNKVDGPAQEALAAEFYALGQELHLISSAHGHGVRGLLEEIADRLDLEQDQEAEPEEGPVRVALLGRPNVGKSSLLNQLTGQERVVVSQVPGTTRDALDTPLSLQGRDYVLIDTAGVRRPGRVAPGLEKAGVFRSLRACQRAQVAVCLLDASEGVTDQDLHVIGQAVEIQRGLVIVLNKWDLLKGQAERQKQARQQCQRALRFAPWAPLLTMSALTGKGVKDLLPTVDRVFAQYSRRITTGALNQALEEIVARHPPPSGKGRSLKIFYATQASIRPPTVVLFVNNPAGVHFSYRRYLTNQLRAALELDNSPLRLVFRQRGGRRGSRGRA